VTLYGLGLWELRWARWISRQLFEDSSQDLMPQAFDLATFPHQRQQSEVEVSWPISLLPQIANPPTTNFKKEFQPQILKTQLYTFPTPNHKSQNPDGFDPFDPATATIRWVLMRLGSVICGVLMRPVGVWLWSDVDVGVLGGWLWTCGYGGVAEEAW
jgi:hypothetical protein